MTQCSPARFRSCSDLRRVFFLCRGSEKDKVKHMRMADKGDEAKIGKRRIKTDVGKGIIGRIYA